jgi:hypothetical protein
VLSDDEDDEPEEEAAVEPFNFEAEAPPLADIEK